MRWAVRIAIGVVLAMLCSSGATAAEPRALRSDTVSAQVRTTLDGYLSTLRSIRNAKDSAPVESLYARGLRAAAALMAPDSDGDQNALEALDSTTFAKLQIEFEGFNVWREETVAAMPQPGFFLGISRAHGDTADTAYFAALEYMYPDANAFPIYVQVLTDYSGCTRFGSGTFTETYAKWFAFVTRYPNRYASCARMQLESLTDELNRPCACGDRASVEKELRGFLERLPSAPLSPRVRALLGEVEVGAAKVRYHCRPS